MQKRTVQDYLREEYFSLLPEIRRVTEYMEAQIKYHLLAISSKLKKFEQVTVSTRIKDCESAVESLRQRSEGAIFDPDKYYTLTDLKDLAGVRVLAFPRSLVSEVNQTLRAIFPSWTEDPVHDEHGSILAFKYWGHSELSNRILAEYQVVSSLTGLFWQVEHSALYKPLPHLKRIAQSPKMLERTQIVLEALKSFEEEFERLVRTSDSYDS